jgi:flagellar P-ring protein FlgI
MKRRAGEAMKKILLIILAAAVPLTAQITVKLKDITQISGVRDNQLIGYGLTVGLNGRGDSSKCKITKDTAAALFDKFNIRVDAQDIISRNIAAVIVTATLPSFCEPGSRIDVKISSVGDAGSIENGELLQTFLKAGDGSVYAVAQGTIITVYRDKNDMFGRMTVGYIPNGALVEKNTLTSLVNNGKISLVLGTADFTTMKNAIDGINNQTGRIIASSVNDTVLDVLVPAQYSKNPAAFISEIGNIEIEPGNIARVVIDRRSGTVVMGGDIKISAVAISQKSLNVDVGMEGMVQNWAGSKRPDNSFVLDEGTDVKTIVDGLNRMGAKTDDVISIMRALKVAGALHAELIII